MTTIAAALDAIYIAYWRMEIDTLAAITKIQAAADITEVGARNLLESAQLPSARFTAPAAPHVEVGGRTAGQVLGEGGGAE